MFLPVYPDKQLPQVLTAPTQVARFNAAQLGASEQSTTLKAADARFIDWYTASDENNGNKTR